eukprot:scaffold244991_cov23-Tisochrysis_lutea.AAC.2
MEEGWTLAHASTPLLLGCSGAGTLKDQLARACTCGYSKDQLQEELRDVNDQMKKEEESKGSLQVRTCMPTAVRSFCFFLAVLSHLPGWVCSQLSPVWKCMRAVLAEALQFYRTNVWGVALLPAGHSGPPHDGMRLAAPRAVIDTTCVV